jgi:hypothetical protein
LIVAIVNHIDVNFLQYRKRNGRLEVTGMKTHLFQRRRKLLLASASIVALALSAWADPPEKKIESPLAPLAFLTTHEWEAKLPARPDGKEMKIHAHFEWAQNGHAILIRNQFVVDGKSAPYVEGLYAWNPQKRAIEFWYCDAKGSLSEGTVKVDEGKLVHDFQEITPDGNAKLLVARVTSLGASGWENEIFTRKDDALIPIVKVRYEPAP